MHPDDFVLVAVINRKRDLTLLRTQGQYRVPLVRWPSEGQPDAIAFFLSGAAARGYPSTGIYEVAMCRGYELVRRRDLLPDEAHHPRADALYTCFTLGPLEALPAPITNPGGRAFAFIQTTGQALRRARTIADLTRPMRPAEALEEAYAHLRRAGLAVWRYWVSPRQAVENIPALHVLCVQGVLSLVVNPAQPAHVCIEPEWDEDELLRRVRAEAAGLGGLRVVGTEVS